MNLRTKGISFFAAATLALCLTGGAIAQDDTGSTILVVEDGDCIGSIGSAVVDFGVYASDGSGFIPVENNVTHTMFALTADDKTAKQEGCDVEIATTRLTLDGSGEEPGIPVTLHADSVPPASTIIVRAPNQGSVSINASISSSLSDAVIPGTYRGTITVTNVASQG